MVLKSGQNLEQIAVPEHRTLCFEVFLTDHSIIIANSINDFRKQNEMHIHLCMFQL